MRGILLVPVALTVAVLAAGCGGDSPAGPGNGSGSGSGLQLETFQPAALVIGQADMTGARPNANGPVSALGLSSPSAAGGGAYYLPDTQNHRILGYGAFPTSSGAAAAFVLGQPDFSSTQPGTSDHTFRFPADCAVADGRLFVADSGNHRVLIWNSLPAGDAPADVVLGQPDFTTSTRSLGASGFDNPARVAVAGGRLLVVDQLNNRVLIWNAIPQTNGAPADVVLGQPDFDSGTSGLSASSLFDPIAIWTDGTRIAVGDGINQRVLIWSSFPTANGAPADVVVGAPDFDTRGGGEPNPTDVQCPSGVASDGRSLFVADCELSRVLIFTPFPTSSFAAASGVLGQNGFATAAKNDANQDGAADLAPTARTLFSPKDVKVVENRLIVADTGNNRVLVYESAAP